MHHPIHNSAAPQQEGLEPREKSTPEHWCQLTGLFPQLAALGYATTSKGTLCSQTELSNKEPSCLCANTVTSSHVHTYSLTCILIGQNFTLEQMLLNIYQIVIIIFKSLRGGMVHGGIWEYAFLSLISLLTTSKIKWSQFSSWMTYRACFPGMTECFQWTFIRFPSHLYTFPKAANKSLCIRILWRASLDRLSLVLNTF